MEILKLLRFILFPISFIYSSIIFVKNKLYQFNIIKPYCIPKKSIVVGNLSMGGTGKSPMVDFLIGHFLNDFQINILSRGYGRKTKGFFLVSEKNQSFEVGDEPLMYKKKHQDKILVAVSESRELGVKELLKLNNPDLFILDDAFQHRKVKAGFQILLTEFSKPYFNDFILPIGNLREFKTACNRADLLVFTKCPDNFSQEIKMDLIKKSSFNPNKIFFSKIKYSNLIPFTNYKVDNLENILLVTGIANPMPLKNHLEKYYNVTVIKFPDHHNYNDKDIALIHKKFDIFAKDKKGIITTEKDYMRLCSLDLYRLVNEYPWFYQAISIKIDRENEFLNEIKAYVRAN